ncbi:hypothetical protein [uncultured Tenacibaculum sp.]|uniref:hypothetical protein n=1 Tax=uncultured Tenacibaculum sp. TaxID=174713 RepID=UPI002618B862|nr:hypothetical protein [uncultured Tenacibaculum sp.]
MRNQRNEQKKLSLKKFQIAKIKNLQMIVGGNSPFNYNNDDDDDDDSGVDTQNNQGKL